MLVDRRSRNRTLQAGGTGILGALVLLGLGVVGAGPSNNSTVYDQVFPCVSRPCELRELGVSIRGTIGDVSVKPGDRVKVGEEIVKIDDKAQLQTVELAKVSADDMSELRLAERNLQFREEELQLVESTHAQSATAPSELREARFQRDRAAIEVESAKFKVSANTITLKREQARLDEMRIRAPFDGAVLDVHKRAGETVDQGTTVVTVISIDPLWLEVNVDTRLAVQLQVGQPAVVEWEDIDNVDPMPGTIIFKSPAANAGARKIQLRVEVPNAKGVPSGMHGKVKFVKPAGAP